MPAPKLPRATARLIRRIGAEIRARRKKLRVSVDAAACAAGITTD